MLSCLRSFVRQDFVASSVCLVSPVGVRPSCFVYVLSTSAIPARRVILRLYPDDFRFSFCLRLSSLTASGSGFVCSILRFVSVFILFFILLFTFCLFVFRYMLLSFLHPVGCDVALCGRGYSRQRGSPLACLCIALGAGTARPLADV